MANLIANKITNDFLTSSGGLAIGKSIESIIKNDPLNKIEISFSGVKNVTPSFVNGAFLYLIDNYGVDYFRENIKVVNASAEVAKIIGNSVRVYLNWKK